ncbi:DUF982 domain-containing protein [Rhizobium skierniewicense]|nr:DUF982 domain-containing protein [Rhizobium skierniewicense]NTF34538.1 DUF982 domain-containing protein [Rhizobium skierniewicense]
MKPDLFTTPVNVLVGLGLPTPIHSVTDAYQLLMDWRGSPHDGAKAMALKACKAALNGEIDPDVARGVFVAYAEKHDLLAPDVAAPAFKRTQSRNPHTC